MKLKDRFSQWFSSSKLAEATPRDPKKTQVKKIGLAYKDGGRSEFEDQPIELEEISKAYHTDSYIKRAVDKHADLMFKEGWDIAGRNEQAAEYVWTRLKLMEEATATPMEELFYQVAYDLVLYGNAYLVKARQKGSQAGATGIKAVGYTSKQPVAGYFILPATVMKVSRDEFGKVLAYEQSSEGGEGVRFKQEDIVHFTYKRPTGRAYGVPFVFNVIDDVKLLRQIEENVARLIHRNLFPLYIYQVGIDKPGYEASDEEIETIREEIRDMPMDGGIVLPERHNISTVGAGGEALDASDYLKYYRQRVFTGLGMSDSVMGVGDSANKSTSDNHSADLHDGVKEFQRAFTESFQFNIINELLFEGGYDPVLNVDDEVRFTFNEVAYDAKIKKENHLTQLFTQNVITHEEMRMMMGLDPVTDEGRLYANMFAAINEGANNQGDNKNQPENQAGKQKSPGAPKRESIKESVEEEKQALTEQEVVVNLKKELPIDTYLFELKKAWTSLSEDVVQMTAGGKSQKEIEMFTFGAVKGLVASTNKKHVESAIRIGAKHVAMEHDYNGSLVHTLPEQLINKDNPSVEKLVDDMKVLFDKKMKEGTSSSILSIFESNQYRLKFIAKTEVYKGYNYGRGMMLKTLGYDKASIRNESSCEKCNKKKTIMLGDSFMRNMPPHHPNCECIVYIKPKKEVLS